MDEIILDAFGKINLALDVLYKRHDGYHEINTIMQQIDLKDTIILRNRPKGISIQCDDNRIPTDERNLVYKAWEKMVEETKKERGLEVIIKKRIPPSAGLAGGSTDAAAVLKGLNILWDLNMSQKELMEIGRGIGADVPFCILGGTAQAKGIGERLKSLKGFSNKLILLANIGIEISTKYVYENLNLKRKGSPIDIDQIAKYIEEDNLIGLAKNMVNILETVVVKEYPIIEEIKKEMLEEGALGSLMSGSGPTVFGIFDDEDKLNRCKKVLEKKIDMVIATKTI
ncbi:MAG: 4-(cytidine 5'-diphospho)-2-C-methyl-D-erythritol kinase [Tissierellia bacterium]|nr:4-(cytidine 5'-diphospho)-2-C-methyl-D-erythritol kinase [Tissierellia bacterium]